MDKKVISLLNDFSRAPLGRYITDGPNSGEKFRDQYIVPALKHYDRVEIDLDGTRAIGSSFLEEAFGGLLRLGYSSSDLLKRIELRSDNDSLVVQIKRYLSGR